METECNDGYFNFQKSKLRQIKDIFFQLTFKDKTIKNRIDELWLGLELKANFADSKKPYFVNGASVYLKRGQLAICKKTYSEDRKISISVFNRILSILEENKLILQKNIIGIRGHSIITILNYGDSKKISNISKNSKSDLKDFIGPSLPPSDNSESIDPIEENIKANKTITDLKKYKTPQPKELLNIKTNKLRINNTTTGPSSSLKNILEIFKEKLPNAKIQLEKFKNQLEYSNMDEFEIKKRIDIIANSPVLTHFCKSINFIFTLENKQSIGYKRELDYLYYNKNEICFLKTNADLQEKLNDMAVYLDCSREILDQYLTLKGFDLKKPEMVNEEPVVCIDPTDYSLNFDGIPNKNEIPEKSESPIDPYIKTVKQKFTRKYIEKTLIKLFKKIPEKREKIESFFKLLDLTGRVNPGFCCS